MIPTLNEEKNIGELLKRITAGYPGMAVIVVDDGSRDKTLKIAGSARFRKQVKILDRKAKKRPRGLTASVIDGILESRSEYAIVIDADMQHPPERIKNIAAMLSAGSDLAVANRARVTDWSAYRKIISRVFMYTGKIILFITAKETCVDIFSGFFGVRRSVFMSVYLKNRRRFVGNGYKVLFDFLKCVDRGTLSISNVPFVFHIRRFGASKAGTAQGIALLRSFFS